MYRVSISISMFCMLQNTRFGSRSCAMRPIPSDHFWSIEPYWAMLLSIALLTDSVYWFLYWSPMISYDLSWKLSQVVALLLSHGADPSLRAPAARRAEADSQCEAKLHQRMPWCLNSLEKCLRTASKTHRFTPCADSNSSAQRITTLDIGQVWSRQLHLILPCHPYHLRPLYIHLFLVFSSTLVYYIILHPSSIFWSIILYALLFIDCIYLFV